MWSLKSKKPFKSFGTAAALAAVPLFFSSPSANAAEVDFSCMDLNVKGKRQVTESYKEYDVIIQNNCPGTAYWSMCIDRLDPWTGEILASHSPSGQVKAGEKSRVNLQMKRVPNATFSRSRFQEFYVDVGYSIKIAASSSCKARECREQNQSKRAEVMANDQARLDVEKALAARLAEDCPQSGWEAAVEDDCELNVREIYQPELDRLVENEAALREGLANIQPAECRIYGGGLVMKLQEP